jgi:serine/threonine protein kinase
MINTIVPERERQWIESIALPNSEDKVNKPDNEEFGNENIPWSLPPDNPLIEVGDITLNRQDIDPEVSKTIDSMGRDSKEISNTYEKLPWKVIEGEPARWLINSTVVGGGSFGYVYEAYDRKLGKIVMAKQMKPILTGALAGLEEELETELAIEREAKTIAAISSETRGVPEVYKIVKTPEDIYVFMEKIEGPTLEEALNLEETISPEQALETVGEICEIVETIVNQGFFHRDLKPSNIILDKNDRGKPKVIDFGASSGSYPDSDKAHTPGYAAPERTYGSGVEPTERTEVYSLGKILGVFISKIDATSTSFSVIEDMDKIKDKAIQEDPEKRYQTVKELKEAMRQLRAKINS